MVDGALVFPQAKESACYPGEATVPGRVLDVALGGIVWTE